LNRRLPAESTQYGEQLSVGAGNGAADGASEAAGAPLGAARTIGRARGGSFVAATSRGGASATTADIGSNADASSRGVV
jgi:hypothetical protein